MCEREEWGEWQSHDGKGFPAHLMGKFIEAVFILAGTDAHGGYPGGERMQAMLVDELVANSPMWDHSNFGKAFTYLTGPYAGQDMWAGKVTHFRIRKPRALQQLRDMIENLPAPAREREGV